jgi:Flp pilus assembly protein TadD
MPTADERYDEAIALQQGGNLSEAVTRLEQLAAEAPDHALTHAALAAFYTKLGRHDEAVEQGRLVCQLDPDDPFSFIAMSVVCQKAGKVGDAEMAMQQAMERQWASRQ